MDDVFRIEKYQGSSLPRGAENLISLGQREEVLPYLGDVKRGWRSGRHPLNRPGEAFLCGYLGPQLFGFGSVLNEQEDTFSLCRIHWVYVAFSLRGRRLGRGLVEALLTEARKSFEYACLFEGAVGGEFWEKLGFQRIEAPSATYWQGLNNGVPHEQFEGWLKKRPFRRRGGIV